MNLRSAWLGVFVVILAGTSSADDCRDAKKGELLGQVKPVLYVVDVEKSAVFFRDKLGFEHLGLDDTGQKGDPFYAEMAAGSTKFGLHDPGNDRRARDRVGKQRLYFRVRDVEAHRAYVSSCGGNPGEIIHTDWMTMFMVMDPDGHEIMFAETDPDVHSINPW